MQVEEIRLGTMITGAKWPEQIEIKENEAEGPYVHIVGATLSSKHHIDELISVCGMVFPRTRLTLVCDKANL